MRYTIFQPQSIHELGHRENQEDSLYPPQKTATTADRLFIICDGMGGHDSGEVASSLVTDVISSFLKEKMQTDEPLTDELLQDAIDAAYNALDEHDTDAEKKMGTTLTLLSLHRGGATMAHIGDSRIYHIRPSEGKIRYRSRDHSLVQDLYEAGEITEEEMATSPKRNIITRCMMPHEEKRCAADIFHTRDIQPDDYFYLCTDGMLERMKDKELLSILCDNDDSDEMKAAALLRYTSDNADNHTAILIHIDEVTMEKGEQIIASAPEIEEAQMISGSTPKHSPKSSRSSWPVVAVLLALLLIGLAAFFLNRSTSVKDSVKPTPKIENIQTPEKNKEVKNAEPEASVKDQKPGTPAKSSKTVAAPSKKESKSNANASVQKSDADAADARPMTFGRKKEENAQKKVQDIYNKVKSNSADKADNDNTPDYINNL